MPKYKFSEIAINSTAKKKPVEEDKYTYIGLEHLDSGTLTVSRWGADVAPIGEKLIMKKGDVLFGKRRAYQKKVGIAPFDGIFSAHGMVLRPKEKVITKEYFPLFICSDYFLDKAIQISVGSLSPTINWKDLKNLEFEIPPIEEQLRVAPVIWAAIDTKNAYNKLLQETDELIKSQFIEMFEGKGYPLKSGKELFKFSSGKFLPEEKRFEDGVPVYGGNGIAWYTNEPLVSEDTVVIGRVGAYCGNVRLVRGEKWITDNAIYIAKFKTKDFTLEFLEKLMTIYDFHQYAGVAAQPKITQKPLEEQMYIVPPIDMQNQFADFVQQTDKSKFELKQAIAGVDNLIRSLVQQELK